MFPVPENSRELPKLRREYAVITFAYEGIWPLLRGVLPCVFGENVTVAASA